jgi:hypothetical protein
MAVKSHLLLSAAPLTVAAVFIILIGAAVSATPTIANAYAIPSASSTTSSSLDHSYNFDGSFQNLISPFQNFFNSLEATSTTDLAIHPTSTMMPALTIPPTAQNIFGEVDNWFYGLTGFRLSNIAIYILTGLSWILGIAKNISDWLLGLVR